MNKKEATCTPVFKINNNVMKFVMLLAITLFFVQHIVAKNDDPNSAEKSRIWNEIDDLEKQKPIIRATIDYYNNQLPIVKQKKTEVEGYAQKVEIAYKSNAIKTIISGGLSLASEVTGGISGKSLVDLSVWLTSKGFSVAMGDSNTFGGVSSYKRNLKSFLNDHHNLTNALQKLYAVSNASNEAIQAYYSKYGKYADLLGKLGDTGIFTTRMRLIIEQSKPAIASLENLYYKLRMGLDDAKRDLRNIDRRLNILKRKLNELNNKKKTPSDNYSVKLTPKEKSKSVAKAQVVTVSTGSKECKKVIATGASLRSKAISIYEVYHRNLIQLQKMRKSYYDEIKQKLSDKIKKIEKKLQAVPLPTGYETPMAKALKVKRRWYDAVLAVEEAKISLHEKIAKDLVVNLPGDKLFETITQQNANINGLKQAYNALRIRCGYLTPGIQLPTGGVDPTDYAMAVKDLKLDLLKTIKKEKSTFESMKSHYNKVLNELGIENKQKRKDMKESIKRYERAFSKAEEEVSVLISDASTLQTFYNSDLFEKAEEKNGNKFYRLKLYIDDTKSVCENIIRIRKIINGKNIKSIISLENKFRSLPYSSVGISIPKAAFVEYNKDIDKEQENIATLNSNKLTTLKELENISSDTMYVYTAFSKNHFGQIKQLTSLYKKQKNSATNIKMLLKNLKIEIENFLVQKRIPRDARKNLTVYYENILKKFRRNFSCVSLDDNLIKGVPEDLIEVKRLLSRLGGKQTYFNAKYLIAEVKEFYKKVENFYLGEGESYKAEYKDTVNRYNAYLLKIDKTYRNKLLPSDKETLDSILYKINLLLAEHKDHIKSLHAEQYKASIREMYNQFKEAYESKDIASVTAYLSDDWTSSSDGTDISDLEDYLGKSFRVFDEINYNISNINIQPLGNDKYRVSYNVDIIGQIYDDDITHEEKSSVQEEVGMKDGKVLILKTLGGQYWSVK